LDTNAQAYVKLEARLRECRARSQALFDKAPISLWEEDFSEIKLLMDGLRASEGDELRSYLEAHSEIVEECASMVNIVAVNDATLALFGAQSEGELLGNLAKIFGAESYAVFREELLSLAEHGVFKSEIVNYTLEDKPIVVSVQMAIAPGHEDTWARVYVSLVDITERKQAEDAIKQASADLELRVNMRTRELTEAYERLQRAQEFFRGAVAHTISGILSGASQNELLQHLEQAQRHFDALDK
jgi:PAS domain-containing protein